MTIDVATVHIDDRSCQAIRCNTATKGRDMRLRFLGKNSTGGQSPTLYATDRDSYVVQGWIVTNPDVLALLRISDEETVVEIPARLLDHLAEDGVDGTITQYASPVVHVNSDGNLIVQGARVTDVRALTAMNIPDHETCVEVARARVLELVSQ